MHDREIVRETVDRQVAAVADDATAAPLMQHQEPPRQIDAVHPAETETIESHEPTASPAEQFQYSGVFRPLRRTGTAKPRNEFANFLLGCFKSDVRGLPRATRGGVHGIRHQ